MRRSPNLQRLTTNYIFIEVKKRVENYLKNHPHERRLIHFGVGDTTHPFPDIVAEGLSEASLGMATEVGYKGYGPNFGLESLRETVSKVLYDGKFSLDEISISDGIKPDLARFALLTGGGQKVAIQDPSYPVYLESSFIIGNQVTLLPATKENGFFPDWCLLKGPHLLFICHPNNPTGYTAIRAQLQEVVNHARKEGMLILFDTAYRSFITDPNIPRSIFEIEGAKECAIEWGSFSKSAGFSGLRLGWCVVPKELKYSTGESILEDWRRVLATTFTGPSYLSQMAALQALSKEGQADYQKIIQGYLENGKLLKNALSSKGVSCYGGEHLPFVWADFSPHLSWDTFDTFLTKHQLIVTPGSGFGSSGEGFIRFSALGKRPDLLEAISRLLL